MHDTQPFLSFPGGQQSGSVKFPYRVWDTVSWGAFANLNDSKTFCTEAAVMMMLAERGKDCRRSKNFGESDDGMGFVHQHQD